MNSNFNEIKPLRYWVQHVLPLVYDDSLSYMELLGRVTKRLNELIENNNKLPDYIMELIKEYISSGEIEKVLAEVLANYMLNVKFPPAGLTPATGDGSGDDTEAIQGCIDYAFNNGGMAVYFPSGSYLTQPLTLRNKATLFGQDRYTTRLVMKGGATTAMFTGDVDELTLTGLGFDGNMDIQVNNVNLFDISVNSAIISNCMLTDGYELLNITVNNDLQLSNLLFRHAVENALVLNGAGIVQGDNLIFKSVSTLVGKNFVVMGVSKSILEQVKCFGASPNGVLITGDNNVVKMWNEQSLTPFVDNGTNNSIAVYTQSEVKKLTGNKKDIIGGNATETITGNKDVSAHDITETATGTRTENTTGNRSETTGGNATETITGNKDVSAHDITETATGTRTENTTGNRNETTDGNATETITGNKDVSAHDITETATGTRTENTTGNRNETTDGNATETIAGVKEVNSQNYNETVRNNKTVWATNITETIDGDKTVNARNISNTAENITNHATQNLTEHIEGERIITIDGNDTETIKNDRNITVNGNDTETIKNVKTIIAKQLYIDSELKYSQPEDAQWNEKGIKIIGTDGTPYYISVMNDASPMLCINILNNGCVADGETDNTTAFNNCITLAQSLSLPVFVPAGMYIVNSFDPFGSEVQFFGDGQFDVNGFKFSLAYRNNGEHNYLRKQLFVNNTNINTESDYYEPGNNTPFTYLCNYKGGMNGGDNEGEPTRTGYAPFYISAQNYGDGDLECLHLNALVDNPGSSNKYHVPAVCFINGDMQATTNNVYLNPFEFNLQDGGNDNVACIGFVENFYRNGTGGGDYRRFIGIRLQNKGKNRIDAAFQAAGSGTNSWTTIFDATRSPNTENALSMVNGQSIRWGYSPEGFYVSPGYTKNIAINVTANGQYMQLLNEDNSIVLSSTFTTINSSDLNTKHIKPIDDDTYSLGSSERRWKNIYSSTPEISVSDKRLKQDIQAIDTKIFEAWEKVSYNVFRFRNAVKEKGDEARYHIGVIAQDIIEAFEGIGLNAFDYGLVCKDEESKEYVEEYVLVEEAKYDGLVCVKDAQYKKVTKTITHPEVLSVRYSECLALECAYLRWKIDNLK